MGKLTKKDKLYIGIITSATAGLSVSGAYLINDIIKDPTETMLKIEQELEDDCDIAFYMIDRVKYGTLGDGEFYLSLDAKASENRQKYTIMYSIDEVLYNDIRNRVVDKPESGWLKFDNLSNEFCEILLNIVNTYEPISTSETKGPSIDYVVTPPDLKNYTTKNDNLIM